MIGETVVSQILDAIPHVEGFRPNALAFFVFIAAEAILIERAIKLHPEDLELKKKADANDYPSRFRK